jgi:hypothetical protein
MNIVVEDGIEERLRRRVTNTKGFKKGISAHYHEGVVNRTLR